MARHSKHHSELTDGVGKCSVPMWMSGCPAGFCDKPAFGTLNDQGYDLFCVAHGGPSCPGIEIEPGTFSGCSGLEDCPICKGKKN